MNNSNHNIIKAKEIYFYYVENGFQVPAKSILNDYEKYSIPKELEVEWLEELLNKEFDQININDFNSRFPFWYIIETPISFDFFTKFLYFLEIKHGQSTNPYFLLRYGQTAFDLLERLSRSTKGVSKELKIRCVTIVDTVKNKAKQMTIPNGFSIPNFYIISDGLSQKDYIFKEIKTLEDKLNLLKL